MDSLMFYVAFPVIGLIFLLIGAARRDPPFIIGASICLGGWLMTVISQHGDVNAIVNWAGPIWVKLLIGIICSVIGGLILKASFSR